jgi:hypothetical protein
MGEGVRCGACERPNGVGADHKRSTPARRPAASASRQHPLRGSLGSRSVNGTLMEQWQYEVTGAGRLWYCIDDEHRTVWLTDAATGHPKATE